MEIRAISKYVRISPQKVRKLTGAIKGRQVENALNVLRHMPQKSAAVVLKVMDSAVANADSAHGLDVDSLIVKNITADQGPTLKRFRARARGRGTRILKRTSHVTVILAEDTV